MSEKQLLSKTKEGRLLQFLFFFLLIFSTILSQDEKACFIRGEKKYPLFPVGLPFFLHNIQTCKGKIEPNSEGSKGIGGELSSEKALCQLIDLKKEGVKVQNALNNVPDGLGWKKYINSFQFLGSFPPIFLSQLEHNNLKTSIASELQIQDNDLIIVFSFFKAFIFYMIDEIITRTPNIPREQLCNVVSGINYITSFSFERAKDGNNLVMMTNVQHLLLENGNFAPGTIGNVITFGRLDDIKFSPYLWHEMGHSIGFDHLFADRKLYEIYASDIIDEKYEEKRKSADFKTEEWQGIEKELQKDREFEREINKICQLYKCDSLSFGEEPLHQCKCETYKEKIFAGIFSEFCLPYFEYLDKEEHCATNLKNPQGGSSSIDCSAEKKEQVYRILKNLFHSHDKDNQKKLLTKLFDECVFFSFKKPPPQLLNSRTLGIPLGRHIMSYAWESKDDMNDIDDLYDIDCEKKRDVTWGEGIIPEIKKKVYGVAENTSKKEEVERIIAKLKEFFHSYGKDIYITVCEKQSEIQEINCIIPAFVVPGLEENSNSPKCLTTYNTVLEKTNNISGCTIIDKFTEERSINHQTLKVVSWQKISSIIQKIENRCK